MVNIESIGNICLSGFKNQVEASDSGRQPKSIIITSDGKQSVAYLSNISSMTLKKRIG